MESQDAARPFDYQAYLRSEAWQEKRRAALQRAGYRCQLCSSDKHLHCHHRTYEHIGEELDDDLTMLCRRCHAGFHNGFAAERSTSSPDAAVDSLSWERMANTACCYSQRLASESPLSE
jgi:hypothetical protein